MKCKIMNDILQENENWIRDFEKCFKKDEQEKIMDEDRKSACGRK